jgi:hypothetical protein
MAFWILVTSLLDRAEERPRLAKKVVVVVIVDTLGDGGSARFSISMEQIMLVYRATHVGIMISEGTRVV